MVKYYNYDIVFAEFPDETTLALNITGCPNRCLGCHSPHLQNDCGRLLDEQAINGLLDCYGTAITCVGFMGGDAEPAEIERLAAFIRQARPELRIGWYSGRRELPDGIRTDRFDYIKLGPWIETLGPLTSPTTNQRLYRIHSDGTREDITARFFRK